MWEAETVHRSTSFAYVAQHVYLILYVMHCTETVWEKCKWYNLKVAIRWVWADKMSTSGSKKLNGTSKSSKKLIKHNASGRKHLTHKRSYTKDLTHKSFLFNRELKTKVAGSPWGIPSIPCVCVCVCVSPQKARCIHGRICTDGWWWRFGRVWDYEGPPIAQQHTFSLIL